MAKVELYDEPLEDTFAPPAPVAPQTIQDTGLTLGFICDLLLKTLFAKGAGIGVDLARRLTLPFRIVEEALLFLKDQKSVEIGGGDLVGSASYRYSLTDVGRQRARDAFESNAYVGPAPVPLDAYVQQCYRQCVTGIPVTLESLRHSFSHMVIADELLCTIGPAIVSGKAVFIYGPPGTGKTTIAQAIGSYMNSSGGEIYIPHAVFAEGSVVTMFDPIVHRPVDDQSEELGPDASALVRRLLNEDTADLRWLKIKRPVIITGGELNLQMLDLSYGSAKNVYQAPLHIKANGGVFLIDDFGRQLVSPKELLNRWIFPLESRHDFLSLATGEKIMIPFEQLTIFSTNMDPADLVDDAFLRRIRHKFCVDAPNRELYEEIFHLYGRRLKLNKCPEAIEWLFQTYYNPGKRITRPSDARDLLEIVVSVCRFRNEEPHLTEELIQEAARQFIPEF